MSKIILIVVMVVALLAGGYIFSSSSKPADPTPSPVPVVSPSATSTSYLPYRSGILSEIVAPRRILFFYASWCPTCRPADAEFLKNSADLPEGVVVIRINYNDPDTDSEEKALASKYSVTYQHTFVQIDEAGEVVTQWNGGAIKELLAKIK